MPALIKKIPISLLSIVLSNNPTLVKEANCSDYPPMLTLTKMVGYNSEIGNVSLYNLEYYFNALKLLKYYDIKLPNSHEVSEYEVKEVFDQDQINQFLDIIYPEHSLFFK